MTIVQEIKVCIEKSLMQGCDRFIICPFGDIGMQVKRILNEAYGIQEEYILDNNLCKYNQNIKSVSFLKTLDYRKFTLILSSISHNVYQKIKENILEYVPDMNIAFLETNLNPNIELSKTKVGKYSYGPLCNHWLVESVGAFCSIALGVDAVLNHAMSYITTSPMIYYGGDQDFIHEKRYDGFKGNPWYFEGVVPKGQIPKSKKIAIGNDVWLGKNTLITNGANIGNGVIAGAGCVITKDVPDYAVVAGVPAKIIRFRYSPEQIKALNKIAWWDWPDEMIRERFDDFYLPIEEFLMKYQ